MTLLALGYVVGGLVLLTFGADLLVRGASRLARAFGVPSLVVGLTAVAYGTSAPEAAVSIRSTLTGDPGVALGNVVGSNVFNVLVILGVSALVAPLAVQRQLVRLDVPVMIGVSTLPLLMGLDGVLSRVEAMILLAAGVGYTVALMKLGREPDEVPSGDGGRSPGGVAASVGVALAGLALLVVGAQSLVAGAVDIARALGVSEVVVGLTVVAAGTSLPEMATSVVASARGERDIAVGNVVGSNIFNVLAVLGLAGIVAPAGFPVPPGVLSFDLVVMVAVAIACLPIFLTGWTISRWEGAGFVLWYTLYAVALALDATDHPFHTAYRAALLLFVLPVTMFTATAFWVAARRRRKEAEGGGGDASGTGP